MTMKQSFKRRLLAFTLIASLFASVLPPGGTYYVSAAADSGGAVAKLVADNHVMMLRADGRLMVWGDNQYGQLGLGADAPEVIYEPTEHTFFKDKGVIRDIAVSEDASYVLMSNGSLYAFGRGRDGRLGLGGEGNISTPTLIAGSAELRINTIHGGQGYVIAETDLNALYGWGLNDKGQLGNGTNTNVLKPIKIMDNADVRELHVGADFTILIKQDNSYWVWGNNDKNQWGVKRQQRFKTTTWQDGPKNAKCTYHMDGDSEYSGYVSNCNYYWRSNNPASQFYITISEVVTAANKPTRFDNAAVVAPLTARCNAGGTVTGTYESFTSPLLSNLASYTQILLGSVHGFVEAGGVWYGWGDNTYRQLGTAPTNQGVPYEQTYLNTLINTTMPTLGLSVQRFIVGGDTNYLVTETDGIYSDRNKVYVWGSNLSGKAGLGTTQAYYQAPTEIPALEELDIITVVPGRNTNYFISSTGSVYVAGDNLYGQSGLGAARKNDARIPIPTEILIKFSETAVPPAPPTKVEAPVEAVAGNTVTVEWDDVPDAVSYELTRTVAYSSGEIVQESVDGDISAVGAAATSNQVIYNGPNTQYVDSISPDWESILYSVRSLNYVGDYSNPIVTGNINVKIPTTPANDTTPPTVTIVPDATKAQITILAEDTGSGMEGIYIDGVRVATNVHTYKLVAGETISIYAKDKAGNQSSTRVIRYSDVVTGGGGNDTGNNGGMTNDQLLALIAALQKDSGSSIGLSASDIARLIGDSSTDSLSPVLLAMLAQQPGYSSNAGSNDLLMTALLQIATNQQSKDVNFNITLPAELAAFLPQPATQNRVSTPIIILLVVLSGVLLAVVVLVPLYVFLGKKQPPAVTEAGTIDVEELEYQHNVLVKDFNRLMDDNNAAQAENALLRAKLQATDKQ